MKRKTQLLIALCVAVIILSFYLWKNYFCRVSPFALLKSSEINKFPLSLGSKVLWTYICGQTANPNSKIIDFNYIASQYPNYICLSFATIDNNILKWNSSGCGTYDSSFLKNLKRLHDMGVCISISIGGESSSFTKVTDIPAFISSFEQMRSVFGALAGGNIIDGIDFDIEDFQQTVYPDMGNNFNDIAKAMKSLGYVVTIVPAASQLTPACGYTWSGNLNNITNIDFNLFDGVMIQWYQGGCQDGYSGSCPSNYQGVINYLSAFSGKPYHTLDKNNINNPPSIGACYGSGTQASGKWATGCSNCVIIPSNKIVLGIQTYRSQQTLTLSDLIKVTQSGVPFGGVGWWDINDSVYEQGGLYNNIGSTLANLWKIKPYF